MIKVYEVFEERVVGLGRMINTASESYEDWTIEESSLGLYSKKESAEIARNSFEKAAKNSSSDVERQFKVREFQVKD
jgi:hypothetical protein